MKPFTIYHLCKNSFALIQQRLIEIIVKAASPDMIFLLGATLSRRRSESIFNDCAPSSQHISDCFILVLIQDIATKELHEWQDKIESNCKIFMPVTVIALQTETFADWLKAGHKFGRNVWESATVIYKSRTITYQFPNELDNIEIDDNDQPKHTDGLTKAKEFLAGSELFIARKQYQMAAFMLHQSTEQALRTLLKIGTGFHANTHNLERLLRYASLVSYQLPDVFPKTNEQEKHLFQLLQKAYVDTRYKDGYKISIEDLAYLTEKVSHIHDILSDAINSVFQNRQSSSKILPEENKIRK